MCVGEMWHASDWKGSLMELSWTCTFRKTGYNVTSEHHDAVLTPFIGDWAIALWPIYMCSEEIHSIISHFNYIYEKSNLSLL